MDLICWTRFKDEIGKIQCSLYTKKHRDSENNLLTVKAVQYAKWVCVSSQSNGSLVSIHEVAWRMPHRLKDKLGRRKNTLSPSLSLLSDPAHWTQKLLFASVPRNPTSYLNDRKAWKVLPYKTQACKQSSGSKLWRYISMKSEICHLP